MKTKTPLAAALLALAGAAAAHPDADLLPMLDETWASTYFEDGTRRVMDPADRGRVSKTEGVRLEAGVDEHTGDLTLRHHTALGSSCRDDFSNQDLYPQVCEIAIGVPHYHTDGVKRLKVFPRGHRSLVIVAGREASDWYRYPGVPADYSGGVIAVAYRRTHGRQADGTEERSRYRLLAHVHAPGEETPDPPEPPAPPEPPSPEPPADPLAWHRAAVIPTLSMSHSGARVHLVNYGATALNVRATCWDDGGDGAEGTGTQSVPANGRVRLGPDSFGPGLLPGCVTTRPWMVLVEVQGPRCADLDVSATNERNGVTIYAPVRRLCE